MLTEAYPASYKSIATGFVEAVGQAGAFLGPVVVNLCITLVINPVVAISVICILIVIIPMSFMPDITAGGESVDKIRSTGIMVGGAVPEDEP
jgi:Na+/melibiose symporter-like transporter